MNHHSHPLELQADVKDWSHYLQALPERHEVKSSPCTPVGCKVVRRSVTRPQSPKVADACCMRMASPLTRDKGRLEALEKQLAQWKERAQVWYREKQTLEKRLKTSNFDPISTEIAANFPSKAKDLLILRQESRLKEQAAHIFQLQSQLNSSVSESVEGNCSLDKGKIARNYRKNSKKSLEIETVEGRNALSVPATGATTPEIPYEDSSINSENLSILYKKLDELEKDRNSLVDELSKSKSSEIQLKMQLNDLENELKLTKIREKQHEIEINRLKIELDEMKRKNTDLDLQIKSLLLENGSKTTENSRLKRDFEVISSELEDLKLVLEPNEATELGNVDVRGLAKVLLSSVPVI